MVEHIVLTVAAVIGGVIFIILSFYALREADDGPEETYTAMQITGFVLYLIGAFGIVVPVSAWFYGG